MKRGLLMALVLAGCLVGCDENRVRINPPLAEAPPGDALLYQHTKLKTIKLPNGYDEPFPYIEEHGNGGFQRYFLRARHVATGEVHFFDVEVDGSLTLLWKVLPANPPIPAAKPEPAAP